MARLTYAGSVPAVDAKASRADSRVFDVRGYGAVAGDTTKAAANVTAFQDAIAAASAIGGGTIYVPSGDYWINATITLDSGVILAGAGRRRSRIRTQTTSIHGITILGTSASVTKTQLAVRDLALIGPGKTAGGTGCGIWIKWGSFGLGFERVHVNGWGSHGVYVEDTYSMLWSDCQFDNNGGDGFQALTNINHTTWLNCISQLNGGRGYAVDGGATGQFVNSNAERNTGAGFDLRYCHAYVVMGHMEQNGQDGTSPNIYLHYRGSMSQPSNSVKIQNSLIQGASVTQTGIVVEGATLTYIGDGNWFNGHVTRDIEITSTASRTTLGFNGGAGAISVLDSSATTARMDYDYSNFLVQFAPGVRLIPRTTSPTSAVKGVLWTDDTNSVLKWHDGSRTRIFATYIEGSASVAPVSVPAQGTAEFTVTATGAATGDGVLVIPPIGVTAGLIVGQAWVSAADTVTIRLLNTTAGALNSTAASAGWKVKVYKG